MTRYSKALTALLLGLAAWGATAAPDGYTHEELWGVLAVIGSAIAVYAVPNTPPAGEARDPGMSEQAA